MASQKKGEKAKGQKRSEHPGKSFLLRLLFRFGDTRHSNNTLVPLLPLLLFLFSSSPFTFFPTLLSLWFTLTFPLGTLYLFTPTTAPPFPLLLPSFPLFLVFLRTSLTFWLFYIYFILFSIRCTTTATTTPWYPFSSSPSSPFSLLPLSVASFLSLPYVLHNTSFNSSFPFHILIYSLVFLIDVCAL